MTGPPDPRMRASDGDRDTVAEQLREAHTEGRLTLEELEDRLGKTYAARTFADLAPLTADRAKPAVPFGGNYRLIDFALSNLVNANYHQIVVLTQYKSHSLDRHVSQTWRLSGLLGSYVASVPAQQRLGKRWFSGSADAILQSLNLLRDEKPEHTPIGSCIRCGACVTACPMRLMPLELSRLAEKGDFEACRREHALDCIECGSCSYGCPAKLPLVHNIRVAKRFLARRR